MVFKKKEEVTQPSPVTESKEVYETIPVQKAVTPIPLEKFDWKRLAIGTSIGMSLMMMLVYWIMFNDYEGVMKYLGMAALVSMVITGILFVMINKSVGFDFMRKVMQLSKLKRKGFVFLKIHSVSGRPQYHMVKAGQWIIYPFLENGIERTKRIFYDPLAKYYDYKADIPIVEGTPDDIFPTNRLTGSRVTTSPELVEKTIIDASKSADELDKYKKYTKYAIYLIAILAVALFFGFDLYRQGLADANKSVIDAARLCGASAVIVAGVVKRKLKW